MRILIAVDLEHDAEHIVDLAGAWAVRLGAVADILHVTGDPSHTHEAALQQLAERIPGAHRGTARAVDGRPIEVIVARGGEYDLLAVGTRGRDGLRHLLLGSVAERVVRDCARPVLIVKGKPPQDPARLLCAVDVRDPRAADEVASLLPWIQELQGTVDLAFAEPLPESVVEAYDELSRATEGHRVQHTTRLEALRASLPAARRGAAVVTPGHAALALTDLAADHDLAVLFTHGRTGLERWWLGSVAEDFLGRSPCSVLVLRRPS